MKYEMIFGDAGLFDGAPESATHAVKGGGFYSVKNKFVSYVSSGIFNGSNVEALGGYLIAERRIIKEPKLWTWEDKKAGVLPEVGSKLICTETWDAFEFVGVIAGSMRWACKDFQDGFLYFFEQSEMSPIETPAEKARREEDEFVKSEMKDTTLSIEWACVYERGVRAAYRKLKGGE